MKTVFIEARYREKFDLPDSFIAKLPKRIMLFSSVQFLDAIAHARDQLTNAGKEVISQRHMHARHENQLLGCTVKKFDEKTFDAFVYLGDGLFHPKALLILNQKPVYQYDPFTKLETLLDQKDIDYITRRRQSGMMKFLASKQIGVMITTKPGQCRIYEAFALKDKFPDKEFYFLIDNTLNFAGIEDFPHIEVVINTACIRIGYDDFDKVPRPVVNIDDVYELIKNGAGVQKEDEQGTTETKTSRFGDLDAETEAWLSRIGIYTLEDLKAAGVPDAHDRLVEAGYNPKSLKLNLERAVGEKI